MGADEKLGIKLEIDTSAASKLDDLVKKLTDAGANLTKAFEAIGPNSGGGLNSIGDAADSNKKRVAALSEALGGGMVEAIKKMQSLIKDFDFAEKYAKGASKVGEATTATQAMTVALDAQSKKQEELLRKQEELNRARQQSSQDKINQTSLVSYSKYLDDKLRQGDNANQTSLRALARYQEQKKNSEDKVNQTSFRAFSRYQEQKQQSEDKVNQTSLRSYARYLESLNKYKEALKDIPVLTSSAADVQSKLGLNSSQILGLNPDQIKKLRSALSEFRMGVDETTGSIVKLGKSSNDSFGSFTDSFTKMAGKLVEFYAIRATLSTISSEIRSAVNGIIQYKQTIAEVSAITVASKEETKKYEETVSELARTSKFSAAEIAASMKVVAQSGVNRKDLVPVTRATEILAASVGGSTTESANLLTTVMNVWGLKANEAMATTNQLVTVMKNSKTTITDLATAFNYIATQGKLANMSISEVSAAVGILRNQGIQASTAGTGLSQFLKVLTAPTPKLKSFWTELGIKGPDLDNINPKLRSLGDILNYVREKGIAKYGSEMALTDKIMAVFESRTGRTAASLINQGDAFNALVLAQANSDAGFLALQRTMEGVQTKINKLRHEFMLLVQMIGTDITAAIESGYGGLTKLILVFQDGALRADLFKTSLISLSSMGIAALILNFGKLIAYLKSPLVMLALTGTAALIDRIYQTRTPIRDNTEAEVDSYSTKAAHNQQTTNELVRFQKMVRRKTGQPVTLSELNSDQLAEFEALKEMAPEAADIIAKSKDISAGILEALKYLSKERGTDALALISKFNKLTDERENLQFKLGKISATRQRDVINAGNLGYAVNTDETEEEKTLKARIAGIEKDLVKLGMVGDGKGVPKDKSGRYIMAVAKSRAETGGLDVRASDPDYVGNVNFGGEDPKTVAKAAKAAAAQYKHAESFGYHVSQQEEQERIDDLKRDRDFTEQIVKDKSKSADERKDALIKVEEYNLKLYFEERKKKIDALNKLFADDNGMLWDSEHQRYLNPTTGKVVKTDDSLWKNAKDSGAVDLRDKRAEGLLDNTYSQIEDSKRKVESEITKEKPEHKESLPKSSDKYLKELEWELTVSKQTLAIRKEDAHSAEEVRKLDNDQLALEIEIGTKKAARLLTEQTEVDAWLEKNILIEQDAQKVQSMVDRHDAIVDRLKQQNLLIKEQGDKYKKATEEGPTDWFMSGVDKARKSFGDYQSITEGFGNSVASTAYSGFTSATSNAVGTLINPDKQKINDIKIEINRLNLEKQQLERDISSISLNSSKTPQELQQLNEKRQKLDEVNNSLAKQEKAVRLQTNAWAAFSEGLKGIMKSILEELQKYITQLLVVWAAKKLAGLAMSAWDSWTSPSGAGVSDIGATSNVEIVGGVPTQRIASGGFITSNGVQRFAVGGLAAMGGALPTNIGKPGVDSIPALLMPGEFVIRKEVVDRYGVDYFSKVNSQRFADGGLVGGSGAAKGSDSGKGYSLQIVNVADAKSIPPQPVDAQQVINIVSFDASRKGATYKTIKGVINS